MGSEWRAPPRIGRWRAQRGRATTLLAMWTLLLTQSFIHPACPRAPAVSPYTGIRVPRLLPSARSRLPIHSRNNSWCKCSGRISGAQSLVFQCVDPKISPKRWQSLRLYREVGVSFNCHGTKILERDTQNLYGFEISMKAPLIFLRCSIDQFLT